MHNLSKCKYCNSEVIVKELECSCCKTQVKGNFKTNKFNSFDSEDLFFIETFLKNEGNIKLMEKDLKISYPTVKNRLKNIIKILGYKPENQSSKRMEILNNLSNNKININEAMKDLESLR